MNASGGQRGLPPGLPEGWTFDGDVRCPTCGYNLRRLRDPRCPECGLVFRWQAVLDVACPRCGLSLADADGAACGRCGLELDWRRLLDAARCVDRRLFEYTDRPVRAALRDAALALWPPAFWRRLPLDAPPDPRRLQGLRRGLLAAAVSGVVLLTAAGAPPGARSISLDELAAHPAPLLSALVLPLCVLWGLPQFVPTLARCRVRPEQVARVCAYACFGAGWIGAACLAAAAVAFAFEAFQPAHGWTPGRRYLSLSTLSALIDPTMSAWIPRRRAVLAVSASAVVVLFNTLWLWAFLYVGLRRYLRLARRDALALLASTQIVGALLLVNALLFVSSLPWLAGQVLVGLERWIMRCAAGSQ